MEVNGFSIRAMGYGTASLILLILALVLSSEFLLMGAITGFALLILSLAFLPRRPSIEREMGSGKVFENEKITVDLKIEGRGKGGNIEVFDPLSPALEITQGSNHAFVPPGNRLIRYQINTPLRGGHWLGPPRVRRWDPLWLWYRENQEGAQTELTVFPMLTPGRRGKLLLKRPKERPGAMHLRRLGAGKEFHSIRDYTPTDPFNTINWKAYARTGKLLVNQYEAESVTDVIFILDSRMISRAGTMVDNPLERSIRLCASLSSLLISGTNRVGLIRYGSSVSVFKPEGGSTGFNNLLHTLAQVEPAGYDTLASTVHYSLPYIPPETPVIVLSPLSLDPTIKEGMKSLVARGHPVLVVTPSGIEFERMITGGRITPKYLLKRIGRENLLREIRAMGARVIDWPPEKDVGWALREVWE